MSQKGCNPRSPSYLDGIYMEPSAEEENMREEIAKIYGKEVGEIRYIADSAHLNIAFAATTLSRALKKPT